MFETTQEQRNGRPPEVQRGIDFIEEAPELIGPIRGSCPRYAHVALTSWLARGADGSDEERQALRDAYPGILEHFERCNGRIDRWYVARDVFAAGVLTSHDEIAITLGRRLPAGSESFVELLRRCQHVGFLATHRLAPGDRRLCQTIVFSVVEETLRRLDTNLPDTGGECLQALEARLAEAEDFMLRSANRRAQIRYLTGMLWGALAMGLLVAATTFVLIQGHDLTRLAGQLMLVATAGAAGAVMSVLWRMTSGSFRMNLPALGHEMKSRDLRLIAALRPLVGLVFALAVVALVMGNVVPVETQNGASQTALFASIGFLAGFSERFAQDMFARSGQGLAGGPAEMPASGVSAGLAPPPGATVATPH